MKKAFLAFLAVCSLLLFFRRDVWSASSPGGDFAEDVPPAKVASAKLFRSLQMSVNSQKNKGYAFARATRPPPRSKSRPWSRPPPPKSFCDTETANGAWRLEWADEFDGEALNLTSWQIVTSHGGYENVELPVGGLNVTACRSAACRAENVEVAGGVLTITSDRDASDPSRYYSAAITTKDRYYWSAEEGPFRVCVKAKLPLNTRGVWPAHWMLPQNGLSDRCLDEGEMDILEMVSSDGKAYNAYHWMSSWPGKHCGDFDTFHKSVSSNQIVPRYSTEFHEYAVERTRTGITYAIDGAVVGTFRAAERGFQLSSSPWFLILNTAIGGGWPGWPTLETTTMPVKHQVDWVRVVRRSS